MTDQTDSAKSNPLDSALLLKQARTFLAFGEQLHQSAARFQEIARNEADWNSALARYFDPFKAALAQATTDPRINPDLARLWTLTLETWQQTVASLEIPPAPREGQNANAWRAYQQAQGDYLDLLRRMASEALDLLEQRLAERAAMGQTVCGLRELYNLWVDCNEECYGRMLRAPGYGELSGRLLNTLLRCYSRGETTP